MMVMALVPSLGSAEEEASPPIINRQTATNLFNVVLIEFYINFSCCVALDIQTSIRIIGILRITKERDMNSPHE